MVLAVSDTAEVAVRLDTTLLSAANLATGRATPAVRVHCHFCVNDYNLTAAQTTLTF
jgi:hypothetical protein